MPSTPADRNLLFGILAVQMDFVRRDDLIEAMHAWVLNKSQPIDDILVARGWLKLEHRELLEPLVQAHIRQHDGDAQKSLAALSSVASLHEDLEKVGDPEIEASLLQLAKADPDATRSITGAPNTHPGQEDRAHGGKPSNRTDGRFRVIRPHARGGLGEVFLAKDEELGREVALKEIQKEHARNAESRDRFVREAEITGGLEHPGIVPVYGLGHYDDGRPYYAMRFIRGASLKEAIEEFHKTAFQSDRDRNLKLRELLGRFVDVCNAVEYAHSRGVLHRDLKPGNIMLGKYGETLVVDWGLAKVAGRSEKHEASAESTLSIAGTSGSSETLPGSAIGTPAYMSPEQADGKLDTLGPATDVYSLGATLYMLLVGKPPFEGNALEVLEKVKRGEFTPPHSLDRRVPKPLSAICAKAMAPRTTDRYSTCSALAADVEAWMADERVTAFREPVSARLGRWARRHRALVATTGLALALAVGFLLLLNASTRQARDAAVLAEQKAARQRDVIDGTLRNFRMRTAQQAWLRGDVAEYQQVVNELAPSSDPVIDFDSGYLRSLAQRTLLSTKIGFDSFDSISMPALAPDGLTIYRGGSAYSATTGRRLRRVIAPAANSILAVAFDESGLPFWACQSGIEQRSGGKTTQLQPTNENGRRLEPSRIGRAISLSDQRSIVAFTEPFDPDSIGQVSSRDAAYLLRGSAKLGERGSAAFERLSPFGIIRPGGRADFNPDGNLAVMGDAFGTVSIGSPGSGHSISHAHRTAVTSVALDASRDIAATADADGVIVLWWLSPLKERLRSKVHQSQVVSLAYCGRDRRWLASV